MWEATVGWSALRRSRSKLRRMAMAVPGLVGAHSARCARLGEAGECFVLQQIKVTAATVFVTDIPVRLMRRHGSGDVAGSVKNAILKLETDAGITACGHAAPWAVITGQIEGKGAAPNVYLRPLL